MYMLTFPLYLYVLRVSILATMTGSLLQLQPQITSMWDKTMTELTNILKHVTFSKQNTHKHMPSLLHLKIVSLSSRDKIKHWTLVNQNYVAHLVLFHARICQLMPHSVCHQWQETMCTPLICLFNATLTNREACRGGKSQYLLFERIVYCNTVLIQNFCFFFVSVLGTHMCADRGAFKRAGEELFRTCPPRLKASVKVVD